MWGATGVGWVAAILFAFAVVFAGLGMWGPWRGGTANILLFGAWLAALLFLFAVGLRMPVQVRLTRHRAAARRALIVIAALAVFAAANVALYRHDVHLDFTQTARFTPPPQARAVAAALTTDMTVTYFYNRADPDALRAKRLLEVLARTNPLFHVRAVDMDDQPALARRYEIRAYNTIVIETGERRVKVERTTDLERMAFAALRALRKQVVTACFITGHGEFTRTGPSAQVHYAHKETLRAHHGKDRQTRVMGRPDGLDQLYLALDQQGYAVREFSPATVAAVPDDCAVVADVGPRRSYASGEAGVLRRYLGRGGALLLLLDPEFVLDPELVGLLAEIGIGTQRARVVDPLDHYDGDVEAVAIPTYTRHPITESLTMTILPGARPLSINRPPPTTTLFPLFGSSRESYVTPVATAAATSAAESSEATERSTPGQRILALAAGGRLPGADASDKPFRLVIIGDSDFVTNAYFPYVANGELALAALHWLVGEKALPRLTAERYGAPQVVFTPRQMQAVFVTIEGLLPLTVVLVGFVVWWRRR